ncbi:MAG TPA: VanW family protein [Cellulomonadaceae bacterium]|nr:VanW family protein [Cellulomonadaceae bacterium]
MRGLFARDGQETGAMGTDGRLGDGPRAGDSPVEPVVGTASPLAIFEPEKSPRRARRVVLVTLATVVVLAGAYVGACWAFADRVPRGTTVAGASIGGKTASDALAVLDATLASVAAEPIPVEVGAKSTTLDPATSGLRLDVQATVDSLTGFDLHPAALWKQIFGAGDAAPVSVVDPVMFSAAVSSLADAVATPPVDGTIVFVDGLPHATASVDGTTLDVAKATDVLRTRWLTAARPIVLPATSVDPAIGQAELDTAMTTLASPLVAAPVAVAVADQVAQLPVSVLTDAASFVPGRSGLELDLDGDMLVAAVVSRTTNLLTPAANASFAFVNDAPTVVPGTAGTTLDPIALADAVSAASRSTDRTARVALVVTQPAESTEALQKLGITEIVSEFATTLTAEPIRTKNLVRGSEKVNGSLVLPGETFSINSVLAPVTEAGGYFPGHQIENGFFTTGIGGGLSQMGTTVYNAAYFAGFEDVEHRPHSYYFSRYPEGREATVFQGQIDVRFRNNTPYGALLQAWVADNQVHVRVWSTTYWTVASTTSPRSAIVNPTTVHSTAAGCTPSSAGNPGFKVTVTRTVSLDGVVTAVEPKTWRYDPQNAVTCG